MIMYSNTFHFSILTTGADTSGSMVKMDGSLNCRVHQEHVYQHGGKEYIDLK